MDVQIRTKDRPASASNPAKHEGMGKERPIREEDRIMTATMENGGVQFQLENRDRKGKESERPTTPQVIQIKPSIKRMSRLGQIFRVVVSQHKWSPRGEKEVTNTSQIPRSRQPYGQAERSVNTRGISGN